MAIKKPAPTKRRTLSKKIKKRQVTRVRKQTVSQKKSPRQKPGRGSRKKSNVVAKSRGRVDTYKSLDFKSTVSSLMAKGGAVKSVNVADSADVTKGLSGVTGAGSEGATVKRSKLSGGVGSLTGAAAGKLDTGQGLEGISNKQVTYTAGIPYKTVVLGGNGSRCYSKDSQGAHPTISILLSKRVG